jgi:glycine betaine/proline transport system ATP-binding protein
MIEAAGLTKVYGVPQAKARKLLADATDRHASIRAAGGLLAVDDVSFSIERGELFVVMGLSGSGKSTLLRMINRLVEPTEGRVRVDGRDVVSLRPTELRDIRNHTVSMVFQHFALLPHRTVRDNAGYGLKVRGLPAAERLARADAALERVGLGDWGDAYPHALSGGMKQRVGLARALAADASVLLMDEPFSALDPLIRRDMQDLLLRLQAEDERTVVFVTHDLNEAMRIGHRVMVMQEGRVVQCGSGTEIISAPADDYVSEFVADVDRSRILTAGALIRPPLLTARLDDEPREILSRLENAEANGVYVLDEQDRVLGIAVDGLLSRALRRDSPDLRECLTQEYHSVAPDQPLVEFCHLAGRHRVPVTVVDGDGRLLGVVPRAAILSALASPGKVAHA